ncbi:hypothetical protein OG875_05950 [Streptomyces sp. NBC_01498]|uniref:hypothetical protein n=1 Tax=Streptomyces sp. NBC_01498 TaxID=2975870 RepID=UPI002E7BB6D2|nr:hypothetical protein [Streptomyces sp. NBC_01498]WTL24193.1 hypothetical protein OG875_05950 [Streptomyces sp. NBC_01498]
MSGEGGAGGESAGSAGGAPAARTSWWERNPIAANGVVAVVVAVIGVLGTILVSGTDGPGRHGGKNMGRDDNRPPGPPPWPPPFGGNPQPTVDIDQEDGSGLGATLRISGMVNGLPDSHALWAVVRDPAEDVYFIPGEPCTVSRATSFTTWKCEDIPAGLNSSPGTAYWVYVAVVDAYGAHAIAEYESELRLGERRAGLDRLSDHIELLEHVVTRRTR